MRCALCYRSSALFTRRTKRFAIGVLLACGLAACRPKSPVAPTPTSLTATLPIMAASRLTAEQIVAWFAVRQSQVPGSYAATVPVDVMARLFVDEGAAEGVTGDAAFMQSVVETGWFRFTGLVPAAANNFAGLGTTDVNPMTAFFADARTGVRAQIQHLRTYADPAAVSCTMPPLHNPCVDPRFDLVTPKGKAPNWNQLGNGNWASAPTYASSILSLYDDAIRFASVSSVR